MGTTVTALLWTGHGFSVAHIGDSRAYLLRGGTLDQMTRDHTYVQALIDEGRISEQERETHPARSLLLQALGGEDLAPDLAEVDVQNGDRLLLCSDGLSGVVNHEGIRAVLTEESDPQAAADRLVELAVRAGGPDNITCVVADVRATTHVPQDDDTTEAHLVGAAAVGAAHPDALRYDDDPDLEQAADAGADPPVPAPPSPDSMEDDEAERYAPRHRSRTRIAVAVIATVLVLAGGFLAVRLLADWYDQQYYVGAVGDDVVIRQGIPGIPGSSVVATVPDLPLASLPEFYREDIADGIRADDITDAQEIAERVRREACRANNAGLEISGYPGLDCEPVDGSGSR
jgi:protein phosphatase